MANEPDARLYAKTVAKAGESSQKHVEKLMRAYFAKNPGTDVASARDFAIYAIDAASTQYGAAASAAAVELRDAMAASAGVNVAPASPYVYEPDLSHIEDNVHYHSGRLADGDREAFISQMGETARYHTMRGANEAMDAVTAKDTHGGTRIRFALVPMGAAPCVYCLQRLGLGFFYKSALTADHARPHKHCNCLVVPGFGKSPKLKGYDPHYYRDVQKGMERFTIPEPKISQYALVDKDKAKAFEEALGYTLGNADILTQRLYAASVNAPLEFKRTTEYGDLYEQVVTLEGVSGQKAKVLIAWIDRKSGGKMQLVTTHVDK